MADAAVVRVFVVVLIGLKAVLYLGAKCSMKVLREIEEDREMGQLRHKTIFARAKDGNSVG